MFVLLLGWGKGALNVFFLPKRSLTQPKKQGEAYHRVRSWNAQAFPKVFLVLFLQKKNDSIPDTKHKQQKTNN